MHEKFTNYTDVCDFLTELGLFHMDLTLGRMQNALTKLSLTKLPFFVLHVVGTNGKGSTATFLDALARAHGVRSGLFTSPHFVSPRERIVIDGKALAEEHFAPLAEKIHTEAPDLTYFEFLTVLALMAFVEQNVDFVVLEAGLGGHYDATSAIERDALCLTPISMDHESVLGDSLLAITTDKAQAIAPHMPVFMAQQEREVHTYIQEICMQRQAILHEVKPATHLYSALTLCGAHQEDNMSLAVGAWQYIAHEKQWDCATQKMERAISAAFIPGRLQHIRSDEAHFPPSIPPHLLVDGAHNTQGLQCLIDYVRCLTPKPAAIVFSCLGDKDQASLLQLLKVLLEVCTDPYTENKQNGQAKPQNQLGQCPVYLVDIQNNYRAISAEDKVNFAHELTNFGATVHCISSVHTALMQARCYVTENALTSSPVLLCGSLYLLGEFYEKYPQYLNK